MKIREVKYIKDRYMNCYLKELFENEQVRLGGYEQTKC